MATITEQTRFVLLDMGLSEDHAVETEDLLKQKGLMMRDHHAAYFDSQLMRQIDEDRVAITTRMKGYNGTVGPIDIRVMKLEPLFRQVEEVLGKDGLFLVYNKSESGQNYITVSREPPMRYQTHETFFGFVGRIADIRNEWMTMRAEDSPDFRNEET